MVEIKEFGHRYQWGKRRKHGQHLDRWKFNGYTAVNRAQQQPYLTIGKSIFISEVGREEGGDKDMSPPVIVEIHEQGARTPPVVVIDSAPWWR